MARLLKTARVNEECAERYNELNRGISPLWRLIMCHGEISCADLVGEIYFSRV